MNQHVLWVIDASDHLARLLQIKLGAEDLLLQHLRPEDLDGPAGNGWGAYPDQGLVIVSLPQPGRSSRELLERVKERFPRLPVIRLLPMGEEAALSSESVDSWGANLGFVKPLADLDRFIVVLNGLMGVHRAAESNPLLAGPV